MNYLTNYYKNLCEQLQQRVDLLEAGLKKALDSGNPELMKKELAKRRERRERLQHEAGELNKLPGHKGALAAHSKFEQADELRQGIEDLAMPLEMTHKVRTGVKSNELPPAQIFPTPEEMAMEFMAGNKSHKKSTPHGFVKPHTKL